MNIKQARQIFGEDGKDNSDEEIGDAIETAELFKDIFFELLKNGKLGDH